MVPHIVCFPSYNGKKRLSFPTDFCHFSLLNFYNTGVNESNAISHTRTKTKPDITDPCFGRPNVITRSVILPADLAFPIGIGIFTDLISHSQRSAFRRGTPRRPAAEPQPPAKQLVCAFASVSQELCGIRRDKIQLSRTAFNCLRYPISLQGPLLVTTCCPMH